MPRSSNNGKEIIRKWILENKDKISCAVDFGAGAGVYGKILAAVAPKIRRVAIEIYKPYIEQFKLKDIYDEIIEGDIETVAWADGDLAIFGDILEHFTKRSALLIITTALIRYEHVIISIPIGKCTQGASHGNEKEKHLSTWSMEDMEILAYPAWTIAEEHEEDGTYQIGIFIK